MNHPLLVAASALTDRAQALRPLGNLRRTATATSLLTITALCACATGRTVSSEMERGSDDMRLLAGRMQREPAERIKRTLTPGEAYLVGAVSTLGEILDAKQAAERDARRAFWDPMPSWPKPAARGGSPEEAQ